MIRFVLLDHDVIDDIIEFKVVDARGVDMMHVIATWIEPTPHRVVLRDFTVYGAGPRTIGPAIRQVAREFLEQFGYDELLVEGTPRSSGAGPGRIPAPVRFRR